MKRILALSLMALALTFGVGPVSASASPAGSTSVRVGNNAGFASAVPQRWNRTRPIRTRFVTRTVWQGRRLYRLTYRITTDRYGRTRTTLVRRIRIR
jgi:hypothetical protein